MPAVKLFILQTVIITSLAYTYNYRGADWPNKCYIGYNQSPISIFTANTDQIFENSEVKIISELNPSLVPSILDTNGRILLSEPFGTVYFNSDPFSMTEIALHSPSEHLIDDVQYDLEMHFIGKSKNNQFLILAFLFSATGEDDENLNTLIDASKNSSFFTTEYLCKGLVEEYFFYNGSLTTPTANNDCKENVTWVVMKENFQISESQLKSFSNKWTQNLTFAGGYGNNRRLQFLNQRVVRYHYTHNIRDKPCRAKKCRKILVAKETEKKCYGIENDVHTIARCGYSWECPKLSIYNTQERTCYQPAEAPLYVYTPRGNSETDCNVSNDCAQTYYCESGKCQLKKEEKSNCKLIDECADGFICNFNSCIPYFSLKTGENANFSLACESGIVSKGVCQTPQRTVGELPKPCERNEDCVASDQVTIGSCSCTPQEEPKSFCNLHRSDELSLQHLIYAHEGKVELADYHTRIYNLYPSYLDLYKLRRNAYAEFVDLEEARVRAGDGSLLGISLSLLLIIN